MESWLLGSPYPGIVLWLILYVSDYYTTLAIVRAFRKIEAIKFENGMELTPQFRKDVEGQARVSGRHIAFLILTSLAIPLFWYLSVWILGWTWLYSFLLGFFILMEVVVHLRHFRNWYTARVYLRERGLSGNITYSERFSYLASAFEFYLFAILFVLFFLLTFNPFFLGGTVSCLRMGLGHDGLARKIEPQAAPPLSQNADPSSG